MGWLFRLLLITFSILPGPYAFAAETLPTADGYSTNDLGQTGDKNLYSSAKPSFLFILVDDIGWADFSYNGGTARTPNIDAWVSRPGSVLLHDMHSGGTVCSPTRATVLTGRNHFRDCVDFVYGCSDMTQCVPNFEFAPSRTYTVGDAVRSSPGGQYGDGAFSSFFAGKWHLGSFYNDSEAFGGTTSSPITHGFDRFNATVEVTPTATANCQCKAEWAESCDFGHYNMPNHCIPKERGCCFNYWWDDPLSPHGVTNLTWPTPVDDALYLADAFSRFLADRRRSTVPRKGKGKGKRKGKGKGESKGKKYRKETSSSILTSTRNYGVRGGSDGDGGPPDPFLAQISFHNCHHPFIGSKEARESCTRNETCRPPDDKDGPYTSEELDYYSCLIQLDAAVGNILSALEREGYYDNTMVWLASDNGPETRCPPLGFCKRADDRPGRPVEAPGSARPLRGRKRDIYEGGHRVPGAVSWPAYVNGGDDGGGGSVRNRESWETVYTYDFLPTIMDVLGVSRPAEQSDWAMDGKSILPILRGGRWNETDGGVRSAGIGYYDASKRLVNGWAYRHGKWKYVEGSASCRKSSCQRPQLFDLEADLGERRDVSGDRPDVLEQLQKRFVEWHTSVMQSRLKESRCRGARDLKLPVSIREKQFA